MSDWQQNRGTWRLFFGNESVASGVNIQVPIAEADWDYTVTLETENSLQIVISGDVHRESDNTSWLHFGAYEARELAAILLGFADASDARKGGESQ